MRRAAPVSSLWVGVLFLLAVSSAQAEPLRIRHHELHVQLDPPGHTLAARDTITLTGAFPQDRLVRFILNPALTVRDVRRNSISVPFTQKTLDGTKSQSGGGSEVTRPHKIIEVRLEGATGDLPPGKLTVVYQGAINDLPRPSNNLRFVRPDHTSGHIGPEGVYVSSETAWYPQIPGSLPLFDIQVTVPKGWEAVTQGRPVFRRVHDELVLTAWHGRLPAEALTLVANRFVVSQRLWQGVKLRTYLFPDDAHLAEEYLDATEKYLTVYSAILGPYPFDKFAVVENFFPSGLGMPSFTLLGNHVVKRKYVQPYSLGHEIVHSWIGNAVLNHAEDGNWVEGLTTYLANYYFDELHNAHKTTVDHRQKMMMGYGLYVDESVDYPLIHFHHKETPRDNAIGYQKAAMVFHMLRREIGDAVFFEAIRSVIRQAQGQYVNWKDLQEAFEQATGRNLQWFFRQWVYQTGAPRLKLLHATVQPVDRPPLRYVVKGVLMQEGSPFHVQVPLFLQMENDDAAQTVVSLTGAQASFAFEVSTRPVRLLLDPEFDVFRRIDRAHIPPMLNRWVTDAKRVVIEPHDKTDESWTALQGITQRIHRGKTPVEIRTGMPGKLEDASLLILGGPRVNRMAKRGLDSCGQVISVDGDRVVIQDRDFAGPDIAVLVSCPHPFNPDHVLTVFFGFSPQAIAPVARLLFFYGWDNYIVFERGRVIARGNLTSIGMKEGVQFDAS